MVVLLVDLLDALGFLVQLSFGSGHLALLRQQLILQLQKFVLTLLNRRQQLLLILRGNENIQWNKRLNHCKVLISYHPRCAQK